MTTDARIVFVIGGALIMAACFIIQGVHTLRTGLVLPFFVRPSPRALRMSLPQRVVHAVFLFVPGVVVLTILLRAVMSHHLTPGDVRRWSEAHIGDLLGVCVFGGSGLWALIRPSTIVGWVQKSHPQVPPEGWRWTPLIVRPLGALMLVFAALILVSALRHS